MHATTVAIDLAKDVFELAFADAQGQVIERKRLSRKAFARTLEQRPALRELLGGDDINHRRRLHHHQYRCIHRSRYLDRPLRHH